MTATGILIGIIWMIGVAVAWLFFQKAFQHDELEKPRCYILLGVFSLLSWLVFPLYAISKEFNE